MSEDHTLTILLYNLTRPDRFALEDYLFDKLEENPIAEFLGAGGMTDNSEQDIAYQTRDVAGALRLFKGWLREYGVPRETRIYIDSGEKQAIYNDD